MRSEGKADGATASTEMPRALEPQAHSGHTHEGIGGSPDFRRVLKNPSGFPYLNSRENKKKRTPYLFLLIARCTPTALKRNTSRAYDKKKRVFWRPCDEIRVGRVSSQQLATGEARNTEK